MNFRMVFLFCCLCIFCSAGCAHLPREPVEEKTEAAFLESKLRAAADHEREELWVEALREYRIALTLSPQNSEAFEGRRRVEEKLNSLAEEQYRMGRKLQEEGKYSEARRRFLTALRLQPDHAGALGTLTSRKRLSLQEGYLVHRLQPGESVSMLAMMYYGDPALFPVIAGFNQIPDAHLVAVGQDIKVPFLAGRVPEKPVRKPPAAEEAETEIPMGYWDWSSIESEQAERRMPSETVKTEEVHQIASYRELGVELFRDGRYEEAFFEFKKVVSVYPDDQGAINYAYTAAFALGLSRLSKKDYLAARDYFADSLSYRSDCPQSQAFLKESEALYKEMHYKEGIEHYGKEQLGEAIQAWEKVQRLDPHYKRVDYYIEKAKEIQGKLEELRRETQKGLSE